MADYQRAFTPEAQRALPPHLTVAHQVRLECLRIVAESVHEATTPDDVMKIAGRLATFVLGEDQTTTELPPPAVKGEPEHGLNCAIWYHGSCNCGVYSTKPDIMPHGLWPSDDAGSPVNQTGHTVWCKSQTTGGAVCNCGFEPAKPAPDTESGVNVKHTDDEELEGDPRRP